MWWPNFPKSSSRTSQLLSTVEQVVPTKFHPSDEAVLTPLEREPTLNVGTRNPGHEYPVCQM